MPPVKRHDPGRLAVLATCRAWPDEFERLPRQFGCVASIALRAGPASSAVEAAASSFVESSQQDHVSFGS